jgi:hypothetical protein
MAIFVVFVCGLSKWILNRQKVKCEPAAAHNASVDVAVESAKTGHGK